MLARDYLPPTKGGSNIAKPKKTPPLTIMSRAILLISNNISYQQLQLLLYFESAKTLLGSS